MKRAWTLMTALPPTKGHLALMQFVGHVGEGRGRVVIVTAPSEPMGEERWQAISNARTETNGVDVLRINAELPQDPDTPGFWDMWKILMVDRGFEPGDYFVSSEPYGAKLAEVLEGRFIPYDPGRELIDTRATRVREDLVGNFSSIMPEFQHNLKTTITFWGAESTGKTTLSKEVAANLDAHWLFEWARPYLETVGPTIDTPAMEDIWHGQFAAQQTAAGWLDKPFLIQDTDLYSTIGYWMQPHWTAELGPVPRGLINDAMKTRSDLYIITKSNIPFEKDAIRYGVDKRESPDDFWISIAKSFGLNYVVLDSEDLTHRLSASMMLARKYVERKQALIAYDRIQYGIVEEPKSPLIEALEAENPGRSVIRL